jgi:hypothetical protein
VLDRCCLREREGGVLVRWGRCEDGERKYSGEKREIAYLRLEREKSGVGEAPDLRASVECGCEDSVWCGRRSM